MYKKPQEHTTHQVISYSHVYTAKVIDKRSRPIKITHYHTELYFSIWIKAIKIESFFTLSDPPCAYFPAYIYKTWRLYGTKKRITDEEIVKLFKYFLGN